jgi:hypothetical protein
LRRDVRRYAHYQGRRKAWVMMADSGFDGQTVRDDDLVPPVRRGGNLLNPERRARADHQGVGLQYPSLTVPGFIDLCNRANQ